MLWVNLVYASMYVDINGNSKRQLDMCRDADMCMENIYFKHKCSHVNVWYKTGVNINKKD